MPTTSKQAKKAAKTLKRKNPQHYSDMGKKSANSDKHNTFTSKAAQRAAWLRWHRDESLPEHLQ